MATRFEIVLYGEDRVHLRSAAEEALEEIERVEAQLSLYRPDSELANLNATAAAGPVRVTGSLFHLLATAKRLSEATDGAFDVTVAPLMRSWGFLGGSGRLPEPDDLEQARAVTGMHLVELDEDALTVTFARPGVRIDLGAIGKGYGVERAAQTLVENGIERALLHGGTSTLVALGAPPDADAWTIALQHPLQPNGTLGVVALRDTALSVSAPHGKAFEAGGVRYGHVLDPRAGAPVNGPLLAAVETASATEADALSTALLVLGEEGIPRVREARPGCRMWLVTEDGAQPEGLRMTASA